MLPSCLLFCTLRPIECLVFDFSLRGKTQPSPWQLHNHVMNACLPFLRAAALFFHYLTGISTPLQLQGKNYMIVLQIPKSQQQYH